MNPTINQMVNKLARQMTPEYGNGNEGDGEMKESNIVINGVIKRKPVDKMASMVFARGTHFENKVGFGGAKHWETCPPLRKVDATFNSDLVGKTFGRFTVIGMHRTIKKRWVVRCSCGDYETRRLGAILNKDNFGDRCILCRNIAHIKRDYAYNVQGIELDMRKL